MLIEYIARRPVSFPTYADAVERRKTEVALRLTRGEMEGGVVVGERARGTCPLCLIHGEMWSCVRAFSFV